MPVVAGIGNGNAIEQHGGSEAQRLFAGEICDLEVYQGDAVLRGDGFHGHSLRSVGKRHAPAGRSAHPVGWRKRHRCPHGQRSPERCDGELAGGMEQAPRQPETLAAGEADNVGNSGCQHRFWYCPRHPETGNQHSRIRPHPVARTGFSSAHKKKKRPRNRGRGEMAPIRQ